MMDLHIAIVDDLTSDAQTILHQVRSFFSTNVPEVTAHISVFHSGEELLRCPDPAHFFLVFLDICMDSISGIETAQQLRRLSIRPLIVFLTTSREYVWETLPVHPFEYLIKPSTQARINQVLTEAMRTLHLSATQKVDIRIAYGTAAVAHSSIVSVESRNHSLEITLTSGEIIKSLMTFGQLTAALENDPRFLVCNRGVLINMDETSQFTGDSFILGDGRHFAVRQRDRVSLRQRFNAHQLEKLRRE